jgi:enoyl-CoA hydratase/carnithine racemase
MLRTERTGPFAVWTIDRPGAKNALDEKTLAALTAAAVGARVDPDLRAIILTGAGDAFVSGGDLRELRDKNSAAEAESFAESGSLLCTAIEGLGVPVIAAIQGAAFGGGAELALACDLRVGDPTARISFKQVRMGVTTGWGTIGRLTAAVGRSTAARLLFTAQDIPADAALAMGLLDAVSAPGGAVELALAWGADIARGSPAAVAEMKAILRAARPDVTALERERFVATWTGPDHKEAMAAYFEKRPAVWKR